jgi:hypothetical protein
MNWMFVLAAGGVTVLTLVLSTSNLKKKKIQMYKDKYYEALRSGDRYRIMEAGREYYKLVMPPQVKAMTIEAVILKDIQDYSSEGRA